MTTLLLGLLLACNALVLGQLVRMHAFTRQRFAETAEELEAAEQELRFLRVLRRGSWAAGSKDPLR